MPILAHISTSRPGVISDDNRTLDFRSIDGATTISWDGVNLRVLASATGLDVPPREVQRDVIPGLSGSRLRQIRDAEREVFLPLLVSADREDWRGLLDRLAQLRGMFDHRSIDYVANEGSFDLVATADGQERRLRCVYVNGMEGDYGEDVALPEWRRFGLELLAVDPYWHGLEWSTPVVTLPAADPFLSNNPADAFPRKLTPSIALGEEMPLLIPGDVASSAVVELIGPLTSALITSPAGLNVSVGALSAGQVFVLDTGRTKRALLNGVNAWDKVGQSPQWRPLAPGLTTISIEVADATSATAARVYGTSLWETAW